MHIRSLPPSYIPPCSLSNCLLAFPTNSPSEAQPVSVLSNKGALVLGGSAESVALDDGPGLPCLSLVDGAVVHGVGLKGLWILATSSSVQIRGNFGRKVIAEWQSRLPATPNDAACAEISGIGIVGATAAADGVSLFMSLERHGIRRERLPGSAGHITVCVDVSADGFVAAATMYGGVAIWQCRSAPPSYVSFGETTSFYPSKEAPVHDRVTQLLFSPPGSSRPLLAVGWWSGRVCLYTFEDKRWTFAWSHTCPSDPKNVFGNCPGTYVTFSSDGQVVAASSGHGLISFLSTVGGYVVSVVNIVEDESNRKINVHVKGCASTGDKVVVILRSFSEPVWTPYPSHDDVTSAICRGDELKRLSLLKSIRLYTSAVAVVSVKPETSTIEHRGGKGLKLRKIALPLGARSLILSKSPPEELEAGSLYITGCSATASYLLLIVKSVVLVHFLKKKTWSAFVSPGTVSMCAVGKYVDIRGKKQSNLKEKDCVHYYCICYEIAEHSMRIWNLATLEAFPDLHIQHVSRGSVVGVAGCGTGSGTFACFATPADVFSHASDLCLTLFERNSNGQQFSSRFVHLSVDNVAEGQSKAGQELTGAVMNYDWKVHGFWCVQGEAIFCLRVSDERFVALVVDLTHELPKLVRRGEYRTRPGTKADALSTAEGVRSVAVPLGTATESSRST